MASQKPRNDIPGKKFGRLIAIRYMKGGAFTK